MEGDDVTNFVVALDAVKDSNTYPATIFDGMGVDGSRGIVVESMDDPTETWQTQFFIKLNESIPEGTQWRLTMDIKADADADCGSGCHHNPRDWFNGSIFDPTPHFTTDWETFEASGTLDADHAQGDGLGSIAFDLNTLGVANKYYFDNIHFEIYNAPTPISNIKAEYEDDVIRVNLGSETNMKQLVKNSPAGMLVYDNASATVLVNGKQAELTSVEGREDGYLWIFLEDIYPENGDEDVVAVSFTNPDDPALHLQFTSGKYEGEAVPSFTNLLGTYNDSEDLGSNFSYLKATPVLETADPEDGSFNLPKDMKEFKYTFNNPVDVKALKAKFDKENMTVSPAEGRSKVITLTRTSDGELTGTHTVSLSNVIGSENQLGEAGEYVMTYSFGPVVVDPNDQPRDLISLDSWNSTPEGGIPAGYFVKFGETDLVSETTGLGSGSRMFAFGEGGDFTRGLYFREGYVEYGTTEGYELTLTAEKKYTIHFNSAMWKDSGSEMTFKIMNADDPDTELFSQVIKNTPNVNGSKDAVNGSTSTDISFTPEFDGNYILRWERDGFNEVLLANPTCKYVPNVMGVEETALVNTALENAKRVLANNSKERYDGPAYTALDETIKKYDGVTFTAPSVCQKAAAELDAAAKAMNDHRTLCDTYDPLPAKAQDIIDANADTKFARTDVYGQLQTIVAKYGEVKTIQVEDPETGEMVDQKFVDIKVLKDDTELQTAINELQANIDLANNLFTVGASNGFCAGIMALVERIRRGAETLKVLGVADDDPLIVAADNALTDDVQLADNIKNRIKLELYGKLKNGEDMFPVDVNEETGETTNTTYDMTVFMRNPNIFTLDGTKGTAEGNVPGWYAPIGNLELFYTWSGSRGIAGLPEDCGFTTWYGNIRMESAIEDLPAGVYTVTLHGSDWANQENGVNGFVYCKTSDTPAVEEGAEEDRDLNFAATETIVYGGQYNMDHAHELPEITVVDGKLIFGIHFAGDSQYFFQGSSLWMTAAADGFDYGKAYDQILAGVDETVATTAKVRAMQIYDLNGRRISKGQKGIVIVKKMMSDGSTRVEKVVVK